MFLVSEILSLGKVARRVPTARFIAATERSEGTLRNWLTNPPREPQAAIRESMSLLNVLQSHDTDFHVPVSEAASQQIWQMRANIETRNYEVNRLSFRRACERDWLEARRIDPQAPHHSREQWDAALCCYFYQLTLLAARDVGFERPAPEDWTRLTDLVRAMADRGFRQAESDRSRAMFCLLKALVLDNRIGVQWNATAPRERAVADEEAFFEETMQLHRLLPHYPQMAFNALAVASRLRRGRKLYAGLWACLRRADRRFTADWFRTARREGREGAAFGGRFAAAVDGDFDDFIRYAVEASEP